MSQAVIYCKGLSIRTLIDYNCYLLLSHNTKASFVVIWQTYSWILSYIGHCRAQYAAAGTRDRPVYSQIMRNVFTITVQSILKRFAVLERVIQVVHFQHFPIGNRLYMQPSSTRFINGWFRFSLKPQIYTSVVPEGFYNLTGNDVTSWVRSVANRINVFIFWLYSGHHFSITVQQISNRVTVLEQKRWFMCVLLSKPISIFKKFILTPKTVLQGTCRRLRIT